MKRMKRMNAGCDPYKANQSVDVYEIRRINKTEIAIADIQEADQNVRDTEKTR